MNRLERVVVYAVAVALALIALFLLCAVIDWAMLFFGGQV